MCAAHMVPVDDLAAVGVSSIAHGVCGHGLFVRDFMLRSRAGARPAHVQCFFALWDMMASAYGWKQIDNE